MRRITDDRQIHLDVLVDGRGVDIDVDLAAAGREGVDAAGDAVVEARADADHQIAPVHRQIRLVGAVHAQHAQPLRMAGRHRPEPHQGRGDGEARRVGQLAQEVRGGGTGIDEPAAGVEDRPARRLHQRHGLTDADHLRPQLRPVGLVLDVARRVVRAGCDLNVLGDVDDHRARAAGGGDVERLGQDARQILHPAHQVVVLGARPRDADRVALLEGIGADEVRRHLAGDADHRDGIQHRVGERGHDVGGARAGRHEHDAGTAGRAGVALGHMAGAGLVTHEDVAHVLLLEDLVVDRQDRSAGIPEDGIDAVVLQRLDHHLRAAHAALVALVHFSLRSAVPALVGPARCPVVESGQ